MTRQQYAPNGSTARFRPENCRGLLHRIDPRARLLGTVLLAIVIAVTQSLWAATAALLVGGIWLAFAVAGQQASLGGFAGQDLSAHGLWRRLATVNIFVLLLWCTTPWATPGTAVFSLGPVSFTDAGLRLAFLVTLKVNALACICMALLATLQIPELTQALRFFRCPDKMMLLLLLAMRNIHVLGQEWQRLIAAARLRGFAPRCSLHTYKTLAALLGLLLLRSLDRAARVREALLLRGFQGQFPCSAPSPLRALDMLFMLVLAAQALAIFWLDSGMDGTGSLALWEMPA